MKTIDMTGVTGGGAPYFKGKVCVYSCRSII